MGISKHYKGKIMKQIFTEIVSFFKGHWPHMLIAIPGAILFTAVHELAHCAAAWGQGGIVTSFVWLPSGSEWGHMNYSFPSGREYSQTIISIAPYILWVCCCLLAGILALKRTAYPFWIASTIFVWLFIAPVADIANAAIPYILFNAKNDLSDALGPTNAGIMIAIIIIGATAATAGYPLSKRLYRDRTVGLPAYSILVTVATLCLVAANSM